uniref:LRRCT domain-containing protein n=1 Tax=Bracon brevicornis TaxID=1563983 RepID=A0A6V7JF59_9HYME
MLKSTLLILLGAVVLSVVLSEDQIKCKNLTFAFTICNTETRLLSIDQIQYADSLNVTFTSISRIAPNAFRNVRITKLTLNFSAEFNKTRRVTFEESSLGGLPALTILKISGAEFELSRNHFQQFASVMHLPASGTELNNMEQPTAAQPNLKLSRGIVVSVSSDSVTVGAEDIVSGLFDDLTNLEELDLSWNNIQSVRGKPFKGLNRLLILKMDNSRIYDLGPGVFDDLVQLEILDLHGNSIDVVREDVFQSLTNLREIDLHSNSIVVIERFAFSGLSLETLRLNSNDLRAIAPYTFSRLNVDFLDLRNNTQMTISPGSLGGLRVWNLTVDRGSLRLGEFH